MVIYSLWGSAPSHMCEDWDIFLEFLSDINACLGFKKEKEETKNANKTKKYSHENVCLWDYVKMRVCK